MCIQPCSCLPLARMYSPFDRLYYLPSQNPGLFHGNRTRRLHALGQLTFLRDRFIFSYIAMVSKVLPHR